jgi:hypothetical protein
VPATKKERSGTIKIAHWREFKTSWSKIVLSVGLNITYISGYRVNKSDLGEEIVAKGEGDPLVIGVNLMANGLKAAAPFITLLIIL